MKSERSTQQKPREYYKRVVVVEIQKIIFISDVNFKNVFFPILERYRELKPACQTVDKSLTPYDQITGFCGTIEIKGKCKTLDFFVVLTAWR